jgi:hypothetical protein
MFVLKLNDDIIFEDNIQAAIDWLSHGATMIRPETLSPAYFAQWALRFTACNIRTDNPRLAAYRVAAYVRRVLRRLFQLTAYTNGRYTVAADGLEITFVPMK